MGNESHAPDLAALAVQLAAVQAQLQAGLAAQNDNAIEDIQLSDSEIAAIVDGASSKGLSMRNLISTFGPYQHGARWRLKATYQGGGHKWLAYPSEADARKAKRALELTIEREAGTEVSTAIELYQEHLRTKPIKRRKNQLMKPGSIATKIVRIRAFFVDELEEKLSYMSEAKGKAMLAALAARKSRQGKNRTMSYDTVKGTVSAVQDFMAWGHQEGHGARKDVFSKLEAEGEAAPLKDPLRVDEARRWMAHAKALAEAGDEQAVAALAAFDMGLRSSEITSRKVRDLDNGGTQLFVANAKTKNSDGLVDIGPDVQPYLRRLAEGRAPEEFLFPSVAALQDPKGWLLRATTRIASEAGVPRTTPHGLRRTAATLVARARGMQAASLLAGHADTGVTTRHYVDPAVGRAEQNDRLREMLGTVPEVNRSQTVPNGVGQ